MFIDKRIDIGGAGNELDSSVAPKVFSELETYLNKPIERISQEYWHYREFEDKEEQNKIAKAKSEEKILSYYKTTDRFLYELIYWDALRSRQIEFKKLYLCCKKFKINILLDFGGGVGGLSIFMSQSGLKCDYLDVPGKTFDFAQWRFHKRNLGINVYSDSKSMPDLAYDAVIAYDVLEHLFDVEEAIREIRRTLKSKGYFITRSTFGDDGMHLGKNKKFNDIEVFDEMMKKLNFTFLGQLKPSYFFQFLKRLGLNGTLRDIRIRNRLKYGGNFIIYRKI